VKYIVKLALVLTILATIFYAAARAPEVHQTHLIKTVSKSIVKLTDPLNQESGGTGFQLRTPEGLRILTNDHVCNLKLDGYLQAQAPDEGQSHLVQVLKQSEYSDLCLLEGLPGVTGLSLGEPLEEFDNLLVVGHPYLNPSTPSFGRILKEEWLDLVDIEKLPNQEECSGPSYSIKDIRVWFWTIEACVRTTHSHLTTAMIYPGNSGSPAVNFWGDVVGIMFAGNSVTHRGFMIPVDDIQAFLEDREELYYLDLLVDDFLDMFEL